MSRSPHRGLGMVGAALVAALLAVGSVAAERDEPIRRLEDANRRWAGARCRTRQPIFLEEKKDRDGWTKSAWLFWDPRGGNHRARVFFSDGDAVRRALGGDVLPIGTELVARGWSEERPGDDLVLELELVRAPVRVKVYYGDDFAVRVSLRHLEPFEKWARFDLFELVAVPSEQLVEVPAPPAAPAPVAASPPSPAALERLEVLAVSVEPARARAGEEIRLVVLYLLEGRGAGGEVEIAERRTVSQAGRELTELRATARRVAGMHRSSQPVRLPADLAPGVYEVRISVAAAGLAAAGAALFEVGGP